jgi:hypothetical protein
MTPRRVGHFDSLGNLRIGGVWETPFGEAGASR